MFFIYTGLEPWNGISGDVELIKTIESKSEFFKKTQIKNEILLLVPEKILQLLNKILVHDSD